MTLIVQRPARLAGLLVPALLLWAHLAFAQDQTIRADASGDPKAVSSEDGKFVDKDGNPTFAIKPDGTTDYYTFAGYMRYTANCMQCHGPDGLGSSYGPVLVNSLQHLTYIDVMGLIAGGKKDVNASHTLVMPAFGENKNVMCYVDAIYVYLRARSDNALDRGRPAKHEPKPAAFTASENACMG
jgi:methanol metabolism-related c-type cytochrome